MNRHLSFFFSVLYIFSFNTDLHAAPKKALALKICKSTAGELVVRSKCKKIEKLLDISEITQSLVGAPGLQGAAGPVGAAGPQGATGPAGADSQLRIYGSGTGGSLTISNNTDWSANPPADLTLQYVDLVIAPGATLTVPSGLVIRCQNRFENNGTIAVRTSAQGGFGINTTDTNTTYGGFGAISVPDPGLSIGPASTGEFRSLTTKGTASGFGGAGFNDLLALRHLRYPGLKGGGGGAGAFGFSGGAGGGTLVVLSGNQLVTGNISAIGVNGTQGSGGGGGGFIILASAGSMTHNGLLSVKGGNGGAGTNYNPGINFYVSPGGGGGGGLVHLMSPIISTAGGTFAITGGIAGSNLDALNNSSRMGGGGGGGSVGAGGGSAGIQAASGGSNSYLAQSGGVGLSVSTLVSPTTLF